MAPPWAKGPPVFLHGRFLFVDRYMSRPAGIAGGWPHCRAAADGQRRVPLPCLSRQQGKDRAFLRLGKHIPSGALAQSCRLPADATGGVFSPCRLLVTLDRQPEPEVLMASSALSIKEDILAALKDILMRHLPPRRSAPAPSTVWYSSGRRTRPHLTAVSETSDSHHRPGGQALAHRLAGIRLPAGPVPGLRHRHAQFIFFFSIRLPDSLSSPSSSIWTGRS